MINYSTRLKRDVEQLEGSIFKGLTLLLRVFQNSIFPKCLKIALPSACISGLIKYFTLEGDKSTHERVYIWNDNAMWNGFTFVLGFALVFRTSQCYARFWEGCVSVRKMRAEWLDSYSAIVAFCRFTSSDSVLVSDFRNLLARLFSMMHAAALADIQEGNGLDPNICSAVTFELLDVNGIDEQSLLTVKNSNARTEVIFQWVQSLIVDNIKCGVLTIPPPILSRAFQELSNGMVAYHNALNVSSIPFPLPYAQTCDCLLILHWILSPFVIAQCALNVWWAVVFGFLQVFVLWTMNLIALELENPFGMDAQDLDCHYIQSEVNRCLKVLILPSTQRNPRLSEHAHRYDVETQIETARSSLSLSQVWDDLAARGLTPDSFMASRSMHARKSKPAAASQIRPSAAVVMRSVAQGSTDSTVFSAKVDVESADMSVDELVAQSSVVVDVAPALPVRNSSRGKFFNSEGIGVQGIPTSQDALCHNGHNGIGTAVLAINSVWDTSQLERLSSPRTPRQANSITTEVNTTSTMIMCLPFDKDSRKPCRPLPPPQAPPKPVLYSCGSARASEVALLSWPE